MAWIFAESGCMSGGRCLGSIWRGSRFVLLLVQLHRPLQSDAEIMDPIVIEES